MRRIYLDFNATAPLLQAVRVAMVEAMAEVGNPSSIHAEGRRMRDRVERARNQVASLTGRPREQIVFTSGGTEANWLGVMALAAAAELRSLPRVVATTAIEHPSLKGPIDFLAARGWTVVELDKLTHTNIGLVAFAAVNHELGTVSPYLRTARTFRGCHVPIHVDAVQATGKLPLADIEADSIAISAHKIGGPQGVGALAISLDHGLPLVDGGHQERGRRPGTENVLGIVGFGVAAVQVLMTEFIGDDEVHPAQRRNIGARWTPSDESAPSLVLEAAPWDHVCKLGGMLEAALRAIPEVRIHGADQERIGGTINAGFAGALGEAIVMGLDLEGISVSTGAACTSGSIQPSAVLLGMGYPADQAREAVRFSLGRTTTEDEIKQVLAVLPGIVERARRHR